MVGQDLREHLEYMQSELFKLVRSFEEYQSLKSSQIKKEKTTFYHHIVFVAVIILIIVGATYGISSFFIEVKQYFPFIAVFQIILSVILYFILVKTMAEGGQKNKQKSTPRVQSEFTISQLDELRFNILQELAKSPIPPNYQTPSGIKKMHQLVKSGMCLTIDECLAQFDKERKNKIHVEELELIEKLRTISFV